MHLSVGDDMMRQLEDAGCGPDISEWTAGVDMNFNSSRRDVSLAKTGLRARLTAGSPTLPIVLYCGRVAPEKCLVEMLAPMGKALAERLRMLRGGRSIGGSAAAGAAVAFVVVGDGPSLAPLKARMAGVGPTFTLDVNSGGAPVPLALWDAAKLGPPFAVTTFLGQVPHSPNLGSVYATADTFFSPSTCETLGQVFQEAMASGTIPVGANAEGVPQVFDDGVEGYLFVPNDVASAVAGVERALGDRAALLGKSCPAAIPDVLRRAGDPLRSNRARDRVVSKSWGEAYAQAEAAYFRALSTRWPYRVNWEFSRGGQPPRRRRTSSAGASEK